MKTYFVLLFALPLCLSAQTDTSGQHRMIKGLVDYRHELIARNPEGFKKLYLLDTLWKVGDKEIITDMLSGVIYANKMHGATAEQLVSLASNFATDTFQYRYLLTVEILQAIIENDDLALLMGEQLLKPKPPFLLNSDNSFFDELAFYKIENGMRIAEIGAGTGMFGLLLGLSYDSLAIYMNDIGETSIEFALDRVSRCESTRSSNQYFVVKGNKKSTKLEEYHVDKVIVRNAFHHFSHKPKMLASIKKSMNADSELCLFEPDKIVGRKGVCPKAMPIEELRQILLDNGLLIVEEKRIEKWDWVLIRCKLTAAN